MAKFKVEFYEKENGKVPVEEFFNSLDKKMRTKKYRKDYLERCGKNEKI